ncbi:hypothetical protein C1646_774898 [Rhizophagus diaphanus]|nr:hypothetical protein C1646_774898 [Rhizophagus diaphanus] [Rhizophagus sp. MUCL 43196]
MDLDTDRHDHETPEMWCFHVRDPFRKLLEEHHFSKGEILSGNRYIKMFGKLIERSDRVHGNPSNYIYCNVCNSLVFIPENGYSSANCYRDNHFKSCINEDTILKEHTRRKEILKSIDRRKFRICQYKQYILQEEAEMKRLQLELASQSLSHSEKDKLASVSYDSNYCSTSYETYKQVKMTMAENTMSYAPKFEPAYISPTRQEMILPTSYQSSAPNETISEIFISSQYAKQNNLLPSIDHLNQPALRLRDNTKITFEEDITAGSVIYQGIEDNPWISQNELKSIIEQAVAFVKNQYERGSSHYTTLLEVLSEFEIGFKTVYSLHNIGVMKTNGERPLTSNKIEKNIKALKVISDDSDLVQALSERLRESFMKPVEDMVPSSLSRIIWKKCRDVFLESGLLLVQNLDLKICRPGPGTRSLGPGSRTLPSLEKCDEFVVNFAESNISILPQKLLHNGEWKESDEELADVTSRILGSLNNS